MRADEDPSRFLEDVVLGELIRRGLLTPPRLQDKRPPPRLPVTSLKRLLDELAKDRGER